MARGISFIRSVTDRWELSLGVFRIVSAVDPGADVAMSAVGLAPGESKLLEKEGERLEVFAIPAQSKRGTGTGVFLRRNAGEKETTAYVTGDTTFSDVTREVQQKHGYSNLLVLSLGDAKEAMQIVYRMQPNAIVTVPVHGIDYAATLVPFRAALSRTIYDSRFHVLEVGETLKK